MLKTDESEILPHRERHIALARKRRTASFQTAMIGLSALAARNQLANGLGDMPGPTWGLS